MSLMESTALTANLNPAQEAVVCAPRCNQLVLAGAGSGKTRVLVHRIAWLLQVEHLSPNHILAVTFTNKAAHEMLSRVEQLLHYPAAKMWIGTFHGLAHRLLRMHWQEAALDEHFQIIDSDDQTRIIRRIFKELEVNDTKWPIKVAQNYINTKKDEGKRVKDIQLGDNIYEKKLLDIYREYEDVCMRSHFVDFAELLLRSYEVLKHNPELLQHYQHRFSEILVDEFQDTNAIQYAWLSLLVGEHNHIMAVGDDDQSIYSWRGAKVSHISRFSEDFPAVVVQRLEQNYRSTETILTAANALIAHNQSRMGKNLWTDGHTGELITLYAALNEIEEANYIAARISDFLQHGHLRRECAVLYRSNAQSRVIEEALMHAGIPYRVYGGLRFFERAEIKDALCYMRLVANRNDDAAFERVINQPARGIGERTLTLLREFARSNRCSLWQSVSSLLQQGTLTKRTQAALQVFLKLIEHMSQETAELDLARQTRLIIDRSGLVDFYRQEQGERAQARLENLAELVTAASQFDAERNPMGLTPLSAFIAQAVLEAGDEFRNSDADCVQLMTLHSAKGLEFQLVFLGGVEEGLFPHHMCLQSHHQLEEERRLCYVGMTRAKQKLYLTYAEKRTLHGRENYHSPSRFLSEIPGHLLDEVRRYRSVRPAYQTQSYGGQSALRPVQRTTLAFTIGDLVEHPIFGEGIVLAFEGQGSQTRVLIDFDEHGEKWMIALYAKLTKKE
jgi:DNA helicase-2/ATP-dependent DNA helicase PcrA